MKIIQLLPALNSGGVERGMLEVGKYLVEQGHESLVISNGGRLVEQLEAEGRPLVLSQAIQCASHERLPSRRANDQTRPAPSLRDTHAQPYSDP